MSIVTRTGDNGTTSLMYGRRVSKTDARVAAYGTVDELNAALGVARAHAVTEELKERLLAIQKTLVVVMGELATAKDDLSRYEKDGFERVTPSLVDPLDQWAADDEKVLGPLKGWSTPGENLAAASLDMARVICRRAERDYLRSDVDLEDRNSAIEVFLNRLSDVLWLMARVAEREP